MFEPQGSHPEPTAAGAGPPDPIATPAAAKVPVECPGCHRLLNVRREFFGSRIECKHCKRLFVVQARPADAPPPDPAAAAPPRRPLTVVEPAEASTPAAAGPDPGLAAVEAATRDLAGRVDAAATHLAALDEAGTGRDRRLDQALSDLARLTTNLASVRDRLADLGAERTTADGRQSTAAEAVARVVLAEVQDRLREERHAAETRLDPLRAEVERLLPLRAEVDGLGSLRAEVDALQSLRDEVAHLLPLRAEVDRLGSLRAEVDAWRPLRAEVDSLHALRDEVNALRPLRDEVDALRPLRDEVGRLDQQAQGLARDRASAGIEAATLDGRVRSLEAAAPGQEDRWSDLDRRAAGWDEHRAGAAGLGGRLDHLDRRMDQLHEGQRVLSEADDRRESATRDALGTLRIEQEQLRAALAEAEARRAPLETALARIEATLDQDRRAAATRWEEFEARTLGRWREVEGLAHQLQEVDEIQLARLDRLDGDFGRLEAQTADLVALRCDLAALQSDQDAAIRDVRERLDALGRLVAAPRPPTRAASPVPPAAVPEPDPAAAWSDVDRALDDLAHERAVDPVRRPSAVVVVPGLAAPRPDPGAPERPTSVEEFYHARKTAYHEHIRLGRFAEAIREAQALVELTARGTDDPNVNQALWLRNLGVTQARAGDTDEARRTLEAALALCESDAAEAQLPRMTCLIDLADLSLKQGDPWLAREFAERGMSYMRAQPAAAGPVWERASQCFERIRAHEQRDPGVVGAGAGSAGGVATSA